MSEFALYFEHSTVYSNENPIPIQDVIRSLEGMRRLSRSLLPQALGRLNFQVQHPHINQPEAGKRGSVLRWDTAI